MGKSFRIKAIFLTLCIIVSLFTGIGALAADPLFVAWDADLDFISLTFSKEMDLTSLQNAITLEKNGEETDAAVALNRHADTDAANKLLTNKLSKTYTYTVTPENGLEEDAIYTLSVAPSAESEDGSFVFTEEFIKSFKVAVIDQGMQYASKTDNAWNYASGNITNIDTLTYDTASDSLAIKFKPSAVWVNGMYYRHYPEYSTFDESLKDYTVKLTVTPGAGATATKYRFYAVGHGNANQNFGLRLDTMSNGTHVVNIQSALAYYAGGSTAFASDLYSDIELGQPVEIKLSTKGGVMNAYVNGTKVADYAMGTDAYGKAAFNIDVDCEGDAAPTATLSDYTMTQVVEYYSASIDKTKDVGLSDSVKITLPKAVADNFAPEGYAFLTKDGEEVDGYSATLSDDGTYVTVSFADLDYKSKYTVEFPEYSFADGTKAPIIPVSFTTLAPDYDLESFVLTDENGEKLGSMEELSTDTFSVTARVINNRLEDAKTATVTVAIYNDLGQMCAADGGVYTLSKGKYADVEIEDFECEYGRTYTAKCFVWDSYSGMKTIFEECIE